MYHLLTNGKSSELQNIRMEKKRNLKHISVKSNQYSLFEIAVTYPCKTRK